MYKAVLSEGHARTALAQGAVLKNLPCILGFPGGSVERIRLPMQQMWVQSLDQGDPPGEGNNNLTPVFLQTRPWTEPDGLVLRSKE